MEVETHSFLSKLLIGVLKPKKLVFPAMKIPRSLTEPTSLLTAACWEMKSNEPVLKLVKQQRGCWERLLMSKNIFVSYNMNYFDEVEDRIPNGLSFVEDTGVDNCYVNAESSSESD